MQEKINLMIKLFLIKNDTQESIEIHNNTTTIGREASNEIVLASSYISKYHCKLTKKENQWLISDLQSTNARSPIDVTLPGIVMVLIDILQLNALFPIDI